MKTLPSFFCVYSHVFNRLTCLFFLFLTVSVSAQWQLTSFPANKGTISILVSDGTYLYAGADTTGVFRSGDNGVTWEHKGGLSQIKNKLSGLAVQNKRLFVVFGMSFSDTAIFYSDNGGDNWTATTEKYGAFNRISGNGSKLAVGTWFGVRHSDDNGITWKSSTSGLPGNATVKEVEFSGNKMFATVTASGTGTPGVYYSPNNGSSWTAFSNGLGTTANILEVWENKLFAVTPNGALYKTPVSSPSWTVAASGLSGSSVFALESAGGALFAGTGNGLHMSVDTGQTWIDVGTGLPEGTAITAIAEDGENLYIAGNSQVWKRRLGELVGIGEVSYEKSSGLIAPNPACSSFRIMLPAPANCNDYTITDSQGREVLQGRNCGEEIRHTLPAGLYMVSVRDAQGGLTVSKLQIQ